MTKTSPFLIGADPELFVFRNGVPVSAHDLIPGTKAKPFPVPGGAIQVDGTAAEFNIDPVRTFDDFNKNINSVLAALNEYLPDDCELRAVSALSWEEEYFKELPWSARELGCMPDFNAWTGARNPKPRLKTMPTLRTAAGHIHIGFTKDASLQSVEHINQCKKMAQLMDWHVGAWACSVDTDKTRRLLYGKAGACRFKTYGVEYRTLSNFWVLDEDLREAVWERTVTACEELNEYVYIGEDVKEELINYINGVS